MNVGKIVYLNSNLATKANNCELIKCYSGEYITNSLAPKTDGMITLTNISGTVKATKPLGFTPRRTVIVFNGTNITIKTTTIRVAQQISGNTSQTFKVRYRDFYTV